MEQVKNKKKGIIIAGISAIVLIVTLSISFAFWNYSRTTDNQLLVAGDIFMKYTETNQLVIKNALPSKEPGENDYFEFKITGKNTYNKPIWYEIVLNHGVENPEGRTERLLDKFLMFRLVEIKGEEEQIVVDNASYEDITSKTIWINTIPAGTKDNIEITYKLYMWISFDTKIGNTAGNDYDMETWNNEVYASVRVSVNGDFEEKELPKTGSETLKEAIASHTTDSCKNLTIEEDGITYLSGSNECIDFNYVWYSGKLWRITVIYPDGTMKMVTQDAITAITWNENNETYKDSWIYQWLNEDFKETLYNYENIIVQNANWNATPDGSDIPIKPPTDDSADIVGGDVGTLNAYEYYQSYKNLGNHYNGYLDIGYYWWLITPSSGSDVRRVENRSTLYGDSPSNGFGVRPSVNLKSNIELKGEGTKSNPYTIVGDKATGTPGEAINTRISGEYVKVNGKAYRIVGIEEDNTTKLTSLDYVRDESGEVLTKNFGSNQSWATSVASGEEKEENGEEKYWGAYLNNTWVKTAIPNYEEILEKGTYYLGAGSESYKNSICSVRNTSELTRSCEKTSSTWTGLVGLPRMGEMFSAQLGSGYSSSSTIWSITPYSGLFVQLVYNYGNLGHNSSSSIVSGVRPSINLKSEVIISSGNGTVDSPYEIELPS